MTFDSKQSTSYAGVGGLLQYFKSRPRKPKCKPVGCPKQSCGHPAGSGTDSSIYNVPDGGKGAHSSLYNNVLDGDKKSDDVTGVSGLQS